jgi:hypothetical protein
MFGQFAVAGNGGFVLVGRLVAMPLAALAALALAL